MTNQISREFEIRDRNEKMILRPAALADASGLWEAIQVSKAALKRWLDWYRPDFNLEMVQAWLITLDAAWNEGNNYQFSILDPKTGQHLGTCGINHINTHYRMANLGYWIRSDRTGEGLATVAARVLAEFGFQELELLRLELVTGEHNQASRRVAEKVGACFEGVLRRRLKLGEKNIDAAMFSLIPEDLLSGE